MAKDVRTHLGDSASLSGGLVPRRLTKQEFGNRLYQLLKKAGMSQSDLARHAGISRQNISTYVTGKSLPEPESLVAIAKVFDLSPEELLPNSAMRAIEEDIPSFEVKTSGTHGLAYLRVNQLVTVETALKIGQLLNDNANDVDRD